MRPSVFRIVRNGSAVHPTHSIGGADELEGAVRADTLYLVLASDLIHGTDRVFNTLVCGREAADPNNPEIQQSHGSLGSFVANAVFPGNQGFTSSVGSGRFAPAVRVLGTALVLHRLANSAKGTEHVLR